MAYASGSSSQPSVSPWKYDVFLSFRGDDTRKGVVSHLYDELQKANIRTVKDDMLLEVGAPISPSLREAIEVSRFAIVVLSPNYASSEWCLDELKHITLCMEGKKIILPLFYSVDPSDVRNQRGSFQAAFTEHEKKYKTSLSKVKEWRDALSGVGSLTGWNRDKFQTDSELIKRIVEDMRIKLVQIPSPIIVNPSMSRRLNVPNESFKEFEMKHFSVGPYGSKEGGTSFDDGTYSTVRRLVICYNDVGIYHIQVEYDFNGESFWSDTHGDPDAYKNEGNYETMVTLDDPDEFLTSIHGSYIKQGSLFPTQITSLTFVSNKKPYGPFGKIAGCNFSINVPNSKIVGFHGRSSSFFGLRAIGAHLIVPSGMLSAGRGRVCDCYDCKQRIFSASPRPVGGMQISAGPGPMRADSGLRPQIFRGI